jgi:hypothetical protein
MNMNIDVFAMLMDRYELVLPEHDPEHEIPVVVGVACRRCSVVVAWLSLGESLGEALRHLTRDDVVIFHNSDRCRQEEPQTATAAMRRAVARLRTNAGRTRDGRGRLYGRSGLHRDDDRTG